MKYDFETKHPITSKLIPYLIKGIINAFFYYVMIKMVVDFLLKRYGLI